MLRDDEAETKLIIDFRADFSEPSFIGVVRGLVMSSFPPFRIVGDSMRTRDWLIPFVCGLLSPVMLIAFYYLGGMSETLTELRIKVAVLDNRVNEIHMAVKGPDGLESTVRSIRVDIPTLTDLRDQIQEFQDHTGEIGSGLADLQSEFERLQGDVEGFHRRIDNRIAHFDGQFEAIRGDIVAAAASVQLLQEEVRVLSLDQNIYTAICDYDVEKVRESQERIKDLQSVVTNLTEQFGNQERVSPQAKIKLDSLLDYLLRRIGDLSQQLASVSEC
ncbi:MAG: hypothetical protein AAF677_05160 [Pseudomonadota bacterium]